MPNSPYGQLRLMRATNLKRGFALAALVMLVAAGLAYAAIGQFASSSRAVQQAYAVLDALQGVELRYAQAVSALRAYIITGDTSYRDDYRAAVGQIAPALATTEQRLGSGAVQQQAMTRLKAQMQTRLANLDHAVDAYGSGGIPAIQQLSQLPSLRAPDAAISALTGELKQQYEAELRAHIVQDGQRLARLRITMAALCIAAVALLGLYYRRAMRELARREAAELELERQRRFADSIIENAPMGVYIKETQNLTLVRVNRFVEEITGRSRQQMLGKDDSQFVGAGQAQALIQGERDLIKRKQLLSFEEVQIDTVRGRRALHVRKVLIPDEDGEIRYLLGLSEDVTDRRRAELGQRQFAETLERKSRELEAANKELESFSYTVSHDLRAPLRAVEGYAAILEEDYGATLDAEGQRFLHNIREGATRMGHLIQDLLAFSRLGRQPLSLTRSDTRFLVQGVWEQLRSTQPELAAQLVIGDLPPSYGDSRLLQQVWFNLLENAVKYSSKVATPRIEVHGQSDRTEAVFSVHDNGVGFDMRYYDKLFNVFQRLHSESEYAGTGVGLAIVQRVIARHGGRVWARSEPGQGACFSVALPHGPDEGAAGPQETP
jgi:PAS domain S-box-containing protein